MEAIARLLGIIPLESLQFAFVQKALLALGYSLPKYGADGDYGAETTDAVKKFQKDNGLPLHGAVDKITMIRLMGN
mgnify:CR=1 FL=1